MLAIDLGMPQALDPLVGLDLGAVRPRGVELASRSTARRPPPSRSRVRLPRPRRLPGGGEQRPARVDDGARVTWSRQSGMCPWHRSGGSRMRLQGLHGRSTRTMRRLDERPVPPRHRWAEDREHRGADCRGDVHRPGVAGQQQPALLKQAGEDDEVVGALQLAAWMPSPPAATSSSSTSLVAGPPVRTTVAPISRDSTAAASANRSTGHCFTSRPARRVHGKPVSGRHARPRQLPDCGACRGARPSGTPAARPRRLAVDGTRQRPGGQVEGALDQRQAVVGDVAAAIVRDDIGEERAAAGLPESDAPRGPGQRHQRVRPDVALEVDREVVASGAPAAGAAGQRRGRGISAAAAREPRHVERLDTRDLEDEAGHRPRSSCRRPGRSRRRAPARARRESRPATSADRRCARAAAAGCALPAAPCGGAAAAGQGQGRQSGICQADRPALARRVDIEVIEHRRAAVRARGESPRGPP